MERMLAILGASSRAAAQSAARAGLAAYAIDLFADQDLAALCPAKRIERYPADFLIAIERLPDIPWIYTGGLENYPRLIERLAKRRRLLGNQGQGLRLVRDPRELERVFRAAGFAIPSTNWNASAKPLAGRWLVKRRRSSGGQSICFAHGGNLRLGRETYLQEYVSGTSASAVFVMASGRSVLLGTSRQITGRDWEWDPPFQYMGSVAPYEVHEPRAASLRAMGDLLAAEFGLAGLVGLDFVDDGNQLWAIEVNPRYTASVEVLERLTEAHFVAYHADACESGRLPSSAPQPTRGGYRGKAIVYAPQPCIAGLRFHDFIDKTNSAGGWPRIADIPRSGQAFERGHPIVTVYAEGESNQEVDLKLRQLAKHVFQWMNHESNKSNE